MKRKIGVIFDMDGLMLDTERLFLKSSIKAANELGISDMEKVGLTVLGLARPLAIKTYKDAYGEDFDCIRFLDMACDVFYSEMKKNGVPKKPGIDELLIYLKDSGYPIAVASSTHKQGVEKELESVGLLKYFDAVVCGDMVEKSKPEPDIFLRACDELEVNPSDSFGLEDSVNGIRALYAAKMKPIMIPDLVLPNDEIKKMTYRIFDNLFYAIDYFKHM